MSSYPFTTYADPRVRERLYANLDALEPGDEFFAIGSEFREAFTVPTSVADLVFGPSKPPMEVFSERYGDKLELTERMLEGVVVFRHWQDVREVSRLEPARLSSIGFSEVMDAKQCERQKNQSVKLEPVTYRQVFDRRRPDYVISETRVG